MKKKMLSLLLAVCIVFSSVTFLASCSQTDPILIGITIYQYTDNFMALYREQLINDFEAQSKKDGKNYKIIMTNGNNDPIEQSNQINTFIAMRVDLIIYNPVLTSSCDALLDKITNAGIPCVMINRVPIENDDDEYYEKIPNTPSVAFVGCKALQSGEAQAEIIYDLPDHGDINGDGTLDYLVIKGDPDHPDVSFRTRYSIGSCENGVYDQEKSKYVALCKQNNTAITPHAVMDDQIANWDQAKAEELVTNALNITGNQIEVVFCNNDSMALGAITSAQKKGLTVNKDIYIVGVDGLDSTIEKIDSGKMTGTVMNDVLGQSSKTVAVSVHFLNGGTKETFPHEEGKSRESELKGFYWIDYIKYSGKQ